MKKLKILIDMDDTIENLLVCWIKELNNIHGTNVSYSDVCTWDMSIIYPTLSKEQIFSPLHDEKFWSKLTPLPGSVEYIKKLISDGHDVYIVTTSHYRNIKPKIERVLKRYFPFISWENIIITSNKQLINGDVLIDDGVHNLLGGNYVKILMNAPHNQGFAAENNGMYRVYNWKEIYELIKRLSFR